MTESDLDSDPETDPTKQREVNVAPVADEAFDSFFSSPSDMKDEKVEISIDDFDELFITASDM